MSVDIGSSRNGGAYVNHPDISNGEMDEHSRYILDRAKNARTRNHNLM